MVVRVETFDVVCYDSATVESVERSSCLPKCCAPQLPRQFGEGEHVVFAGGIVSKTLALFLKQSTKGEPDAYPTY